MGDWATTLTEAQGKGTYRGRVRAVARAVTLRARSFAPHHERGLRIVHLHYVFDHEMSAFERQLDALTSWFDPVSLSGALERMRTGALIGNEIVITFDDGFRNQLRAAERLTQRGISACFYLISDLVGAPRERAERICKERLHLVRPVEPLSWDDVAQLLTLGHEIGAHTRTHPDLLSIGEAERDAELIESKAALEREIGAIRHFSAPYGDAARFSSLVSASARKAGYESCASALRGVNPPGGDPYALLRDHLVAGWPVVQLRAFLGRA